MKGLIIKILRTPNDNDKEERKELTKMITKGQERTNDNDKKDRKGLIGKASQLFTMIERIGRAGLPLRSEPGNMGFWRSGSCLRSVKTDLYFSVKY